MSRRLTSDPATAPVHVRALGHGRQPAVAGVRLPDTPPECGESDERECGTRHKTGRAWRQPWPARVAVRRPGSATDRRPPPCSELRAAEVVSCDRARQGGLKRLACPGQACLHVVFGDAQHLRNLARREAFGFAQEDDRPVRRRETPERLAQALAQARVDDELFGIATRVCWIESSVPDRCSSSDSTCAGSWARLRRLIRQALRTVRWSQGLKASASRI